MKAHVFLTAGLLFLYSGALPLSGQQPGHTPRSSADDVIRINTELIQSSVIVLDKEGNFVGGLAREQFELHIDSRPRSISFFEQITAGTMGEAEKHKATRAETPAVERPANQPSGYGRTVVFFIDDFHLNDESVNRTRTALLNYVENSLSQNDRVLVIAASGQIGFLQQLTDNKDVLRAAIARLKSRDFVVADETRPPMTAYQAYTIETGDSGTLRYFADLAIQDIFGKQAAQMPTLGGAAGIAAKDRKGEQIRDQAETYVKNRARSVLIKYSAISAYTLASLKQSLASLSQLPGSKLAFLISDGFFLNQQMSGELQKLNEITSGAMRAGTVVYSIQASGLSTAYPDAKSEVRLSPRGERGAAMIGQDTAIQEPLHTVAADTGGRALFNSNSMDGSIRQALRETSKYYLLAWRPDPEEKRLDAFHRVEVRIRDHPDWTVRMQKGYFLTVEAKKSASTQAATKPPQPTAEKMREALATLYPLGDLQTIVNLSFRDQPGAGAVVNIATELMVGQLPRPADAAKQAMLIDLAGIVLNDEGKTVSSFGGQLKFDLDSTGAAQRQTVSNVNEIKVKPGLYQVRVAAHDEESGMTGSAAEWILVPDFSGGKVTLSSLLIGDVKAVGLAATPDQKARVSINHHFTRSGGLRFFTYIYNAARGPDGKSAPDVTVQLRVMRDDRVLSTSPQIKVTTDGIEDLARIPYAADLALRMLPGGRYRLFVMATDNLSKSSFTQSVKFVVE